MRFLAGVASFNNPNDEARVALALEIGFWNLHVLVVGVLLLLAVQTFRAVKIQLAEGLFIGLVTVAGLVTVVLCEPLLPTLRL